MARLLICNVCKTVDPLSDYPREASPTEDHALNDVIYEHLNTRGRNPSPDAHGALLVFIEDAELALIDPKRLQQAVMDDELETFLKEERENMKEDAMRCFNLHGRPSGGCTDWCSKSRAIVRTTGIEPKDQTYLCFYCPVASHVATEMHYQAGLYKK